MFFVFYDIYSDTKSSLLSLQIKSHILTSKITMLKRTPALNTGKVKSTKNTKAKRRERNAKKEKTAAQRASPTKRHKKGETLTKENVNKSPLCFIVFIFTKCDKICLFSNLSIFLLNI